MGYRDSVFFYFVLFVMHCIYDVACVWQVAVMQEELTALQPELIKTSAETDKLMVKIEQDTVEVEAKKEVRLNYCSYVNILSSSLDVVAVRIAYLSNIVSPCCLYTYKPYATPTSKAYCFSSFCPVDRLWQQMRL